MQYGTVQQLTTDVKIHMAQLQEKNSTMFPFNLEYTEKQLC